MGSHSFPEENQGTVIWKRYWTWCLGQESQQERPVSRPRPAPRPAPCRPKPHTAGVTGAQGGQRGRRPAGCPRAGALGGGEAHLHAGFCSSSSAPERARTTRHRRGVRGGQCRLRAEPSPWAPGADFITPATPSRALSPKPRGRGGLGACRAGEGCGGGGESRSPETAEPTERAPVCHLLQNLLGEKRLSSLRALIFMRHGNFDTEKVSVTFSCVRIFYFSRKLQSSNDLINAGVLARFGGAVSLGLQGLSGTGLRLGCRRGRGQPPPPQGGGCLPSWGGAFPHSF